jgi:hypothetical protein
MDPIDPFDQYPRSAHPTPVLIRSGFESSHEVAELGAQLCLTAGTSKLVEELNFSSLDGFPAYPCGDMAGTFTSCLHLVNLL